MAMLTADDVDLATALVRTALDPRRTPRQDPAYRELCEAYATRSAVREAALTVAGALRLTILEVDVDFGMVLAPTHESPFLFAAGDFVSTATVKDRHRDGVLLLAIIATAIPRRERLVGDPKQALPPFTVDQVLATLTSALERAAAQVPEPPQAVPAHLQPMWLVLRSMPEVRETPDQRSVARTRRGRVRLLLDNLRNVGAVVELPGEEAWRPTWRWQVQLRAFATSGLWDTVSPVFWPLDATTPSPRPA